MVSNNLINPPVREIGLRMSGDFRAGQGQDDSLPNVPTMSIEAAQHDIQLETQKMMQTNERMMH